MNLLGTERIEKVSIASTLASKSAFLKIAENIWASQEVTVKADLDTVS